MTEKDWLNNFAEQLKHFMDDRNTRSRELSKITGIDEGTLSRYRNASRMPTIRSLINIAEALELDDGEFAEFLYFGDMIE